MKPLNRLLTSVAILALTVCGAHTQTGPAEADIKRAAVDATDAAVTGAPQPGGGPSSLIGADATRPAAVDAATLKKAIDLYRSGDIALADNLAAGIDDAAARTLLEWVAIRHNGAALGFARIRAFVDANPSWPAAAITRRRAEEALLKAKQPAEVVRAFFANRKPVSAPGKVALAQALRAGGDEKQANAVVRDAWQEDAIGRDLEDAIREEFPTALTRTDHRQRLERLLFKSEWEAALRTAGYIDADYAALAKARIAVARRAGNAAAAIDAVPAHLRRDPSYVFAKAQYLRRQDKYVEAARAIARVPRDARLLVDGDAWWTERRVLARELLDVGEAQAAYRVARDHAAESDASKIDAEFHAGWIALRFLSDPTTAAKHFAAAAKIAETPISVSRAAYWRGRAAEAAGDGAGARRHYEQAAKLPITYYGQLARMKIGLRDLPLRLAPRGDTASRAVFEHLPAVRAIRLLYEADARDLALPLFHDLAQRLTDAGQLDALAELAASLNDARALLIVGKASVQRGHPLDIAAFPTLGMPAFEPVGSPVERPMVYAIARQESAFDPKAMSRAGARGLMQLMPDTAKRTATRSGIGFDVGRLTSDAAYNAKIGATHLGELVEEWKGSYILTFAAYNAGSRNVKRWIDAYGDPRSDTVDPVDWVERIPFYETRNYVQRVMENLQVYRQRLGLRTALLIESDLRRGGADR